MSSKKVVNLQPARAPEGKGSWYEAVGAGNCLAALERRQKGEDWCEYRFSFARIEPDRPRRYTLDFRAEDVLDLPKLAQVLAAELAADGWLEPKLKDDLSCLAGSLDWFLGLKEPANGSPWVVVRRKSLQKVLDHLWNVEIGSFRELPAEGRKQHVFRAVAELSGTIHGTPRVAEEYLGSTPEEAGLHVQR